MKLRLVTTGEIVDVISYSCTRKITSEDTVSYIDSKGVEFIDVKGLNYYWSFVPIDKRCNLNWDDKLIELSGRAMQGILSSQKISAFMHSNAINPTSVAIESITIAKELIEQLKNELKK